MLRFFCVMLLLSLVTVCGAQEASEGMLYERVDGTYGYIVDNDDHLGQWQVAFEDPALWSELIEANPQLADTDLIKPGDELNVPESLVRLFKFRQASLDTMVPTIPADTATTSTTQMERSTVPNWVRQLLAILVVIILAWAAGAWHQYERHTTAQREREDRQRRADPYSGPPMVSDGILTPETAARHFADQYQSERRNVTTGASLSMPERVVIERIVPVEVRGEMRIQYRNFEGMQKRNIPNWTPAWQCFLSDGSSSISLMMCGNDVRIGTTTTPTSENQIRPRQDMEPVMLNQQVWPPIADGEQVEDELDIPEDVERFKEIRFKSTRHVTVMFHGDRAAEAWDIPAPLVDLISFSLIESRLIAKMDGHDRLLGVIVDSLDPNLAEQLDDEVADLMGRGEHTPDNDKDVQS